HHACADCTCHPTISTAITPRMEQDAAAARKKARVLVVDDDVDLLALLETGLEEAHYEVEVCGSAERALELLEVAPHDIIISDINLPGMSGLNFCSRVVSERAHMVVMVMTAFSSIRSAV